MSDGTDRLGILPEPIELHARFTRQYPLDWGDPVPTKAQIAAEFGTAATAGSLELLRGAADHHAETTSQLLAAIPPGVTTHDLDRRVKSPSSLARKLWKYGRMNRSALTDDVLRFTVLAGGPDALVDSTAATIDLLSASGWRVQSARSSYVDGSRYKGLHAIMRSAGDHQVEIQFHTPESVRVKTETTELYLIERDPRESGRSRDRARQACIALSAAMTQPAGIAQLQELGGVPLTVKGFGTFVRPRHQRGGQRGTGAGSRMSGGRGIESDGMTR